MKGLPNIGSKETKGERKTSGVSNTLTQNSDDTTNNVQFPDIKQNGVNGHELSNGLSDSVTTSSESKDDCNSEENREVFELTRLKTKFMEQFRNMDISPVPTPGLMRPATREQTRLSFEERMMKILSGQVHITCPERNKTIRVYICSGFKGKLTLY